MTTIVAAPATTVPIVKIRARRSWTQHGLLFTAPFLVVYVAFLVWPLLLGPRRC
jgi:multiple sugar transport system permease protein